MSEWYQRQFGDRGAFAVCVSLGVDPHPSGHDARSRSWGSIEFWVNGRCLTASVQDGAVSQGVRWNLLPILEWLLDVGIRLVNEDPYPRLSKGTDIADGAAWYDATLHPPILPALAERNWFLGRSEWRHHHALRRAAEDVALPNVVFKRLGHDIEVSWDNEAWMTVRPGLYFVEKRGAVLVPASLFAATIRELLVEVLAALSQRWPSVGFEGLVQRARALEAGPGDWRWLIHRPTAECIRNEMPDLCQELDLATAQDEVGLFVPHTPSTLALRLVRLERKEEIEAVLRVTSQRPLARIADQLKALIRPRAASTERPWVEGNEYAEIVRDELGWEADPMPNLSQWMATQGIGSEQSDVGLPPSVAVLTTRVDEQFASVYVNPRGSSRMKRETGLATSLGHVLLDVLGVSVDGDWEHWPTSARARAFGVALMLPEDGVRDTLGGERVIGPDAVLEIMGKFRTGSMATTYRLKNLGFISEEEQMELARAVA